MATTVVRQTLLFRARLLVLGMLLIGVCEAQSSAAERPNIVFLLADDLGWQDVGFHGSEIQTPHLDRLAAGGTELKSFYVQPVCSPTRGALLSGRYPMRLGLQCGVVRPWASHGLPLDVRTLPDTLAAQGYVTAITGKWHLGHAAPAYLPLRRGFHHQYGHYNGAIDYFTHERDGGLDWHRDDGALVEEGYSTTLIGAEAARLIDTHDFARPLFLYVPFNAPHSPLQAPEEYLNRYASLSNPKRRSFAAMVTCLDEAVGRIVAGLEARGVLGRTLIVFTSDNGGPEDQGATNGPFRSGKGSLYEGGVRAAAIVHWPGTVPAGGAVDAMMHIVDMYPTLLAAAGLPTDTLPAMDGLNQWEAILGRGTGDRNEVLLNHTPFHGALRIGDWKLVHNGRVNANAVTAGLAETFELFNLNADPGEQTDLSAAEPEKLAELRTRLEEYGRQAMQANIVGNRPPDGFRSPRVWGSFE